MTNLTMRKRMMHWQINHNYVSNFTTLLFLKIIFFYIYIKFKVKSWTSMDETISLDLIIYYVYIILFFIFLPSNLSFICFLTYSNNISIYLFNQLFVLIVIIIFLRKGAIFVIANIHCETSCACLNLFLFSLHMS